MATKRPMSGMYAPEMDEMYVPETAEMYVPEMAEMYVPEKTETKVKPKAKTEEFNLYKTVKKAAQKDGMKKGGKVSSASKRADGIAQRGKTKGKIV